MAAALECEPVVAVDAEWPPGTAAATLLQVATPQTVYLVDLAALNDDAAAVVYAAVAGARAVLAYGFASDATRLRRAAPAAPDPATWRIRDLKRSEAGLAAVCARGPRWAPRQGGAALGLGPAAAVARAAGERRPRRARPAPDRRDVPVSGGARAGRRRRARRVV